MKGRAPIRRTLEYLSSGNLVLKEQIKIFSINYNTFGNFHDGARFVNWIHPESSFWLIAPFRWQRLCVLEPSAAPVSESRGPSCHPEKHDTDSVHSLLFWLESWSISWKTPFPTHTTIKDSPNYFLDNGKEMLIDVDSKNRHEIEEHLVQVVGKSRYGEYTITSNRDHLPVTMYCYLLLGTYWHRKPKWLKRRITRPTSEWVARDLAFVKFLANFLVLALYHCRITCEESSNTDSIRD